MIGSNDRPDDFVVGHNKSIINYGITKTENGYSYESMEYPATDMVILERARAKLEIKAIKQRAAIEAKLPVTIDGVTYNGGDTSASAIFGAVSLAQAQGLTTVTIWDINNVNAEYTIEQGMLIAATIGNAYAQVMYARNEAIKNVLN